MSRLSEIDKDKVTEETSGSFDYLPQSQLPAQISSDTGASNETETTKRTQILILLIAKIHVMFPTP